jgi:choice-of-anchor A domain-containing protein
MIQNYFSAFLGTILVFSSFWGIAQVNPVTPTQGFSTFIEGNTVLIDNETEGNIAIGGDLFLLNNSNYRIANNTAGTVTFGTDTRPTGLLINGKVHFTGGSGVTINSSAFVKIGNCTGANIYDFNTGGSPDNTVITAGTRFVLPRILLQTHQPAAAVCASNLLNFTAAFQTLRSYSAGIAACPANLLFLDQNGNPLPDPTQPQAVGKVNVVSNRINVLNTTPNSLDNIQNLTFQNLSANAPIIFNVDGGGQDFVWTVPAFGGANANYIFWNFTNIPNLTFTGGNTLEGTVFAPNSNVFKNNSGNIQGSVIVKQLTHAAGEIHEFPWKIAFNFCSVPQPEICNNGIDDDGDGLIDCDDSDCKPALPASILKN